MIKFGTVIFCAELAKWCCISQADGMQIENRFTIMAVSNTQTEICVCDSTSKIIPASFHTWWQSDKLSSISDCFIRWGRWNPTTQCHVIWAVNNVMRQWSYSCWRHDNCKILNALTAISHLFKCDTEELLVSTLLLEMGGTIIIIQHMWTLFHTAEDIRLHCNEY
jgi:hypothetical protein